jgi:hypothetical protein
LSVLKLFARFVPKILHSLKTVEGKNVAKSKAFLKTLSQFDFRQVKKI